MKEKNIPCPDSSHPTSVWAAFTAFADPAAFAEAQVPGGKTAAGAAAAAAARAVRSSAPSSSAVTVLQTGNIYLLLAGLAVLCCLFATPRVARNYLLVVACADLGHILSTYWGLGADVFFDVAGWNSMVWGHVGFSAFFFLNRIATAAGVFGPVPELSVEKRD